MDEKAEMPIRPDCFVASFITDKEKKDEDTMGNRTRDEVIYFRVDYRVKQEFGARILCNRNCSGWLCI